MTRRYAITLCPGCGQMLGVNGSTCKPAPPLRDGPDRPYPPHGCGRIRYSGRFVGVITERPKVARQSNRDRLTV